MSSMPSRDSYLVCFFIWDGLFIKEINYVVFRINNIVNANKNWDCK